MTPETLASFRALLLSRRAELQAMSGAAAEKRKPVELDQQSVGRLSRQDALQQQAMANAQEVRRAGELTKISAALVRIEEGEFGFCGECGDEIAEKRLQIDPTIVRCVACAQGG